MRQNHINVSGQEEAIDLILQNGANVNILDDKERTLLHFAAEKGIPRVLALN